MRRAIPVAALAVLLTAPGLRSQDRDFLTADEIDQVREVQDPSQRMDLYLKFARERVALVEKLVSKNKPGRSGLIHDTLEDYGKIIEAIDTVSDDALERGLPIGEGVAAVKKTEAELLASLKKIQESKPADLSRYEFALTQAIETTQDSADLASEDVGKREADVVSEKEKERRKYNAGLSDAERHAEQNKQLNIDTRQRKAPTLLKPGEKEAQQP